MMNYIGVHFHVIDRTSVSARQNFPHDFTVTQQTEFIVVCTNEIESYPLSVVCLESHLAMRHIAATTIGDLPITEAETEALRNNIDRGWPY